MMFLDVKLLNRKGLMDRSQIVRGRVRNRAYAKSHSRENRGA